MRPLQQLISDISQTVAKADKILTTITEEGLQISVSIGNKEIPVTLKIKLPK